MLALSDLVCIVRYLKKTLFSLYQAIRLSSRKNVTKYLYLYNLCIRPPSILFLHLLPQQNLADHWQRLFMGQMSFLSPNRQWP